MRTFTTYPGRDALLRHTWVGAQFNDIPGSMQPIERTFFKALKSEYNLAADTWMVANPGKRITFFEMAGIFTTAYNKSATIEKAVNGFRVCGLWPFNDQIFDEEDFIAAGVTVEPNPAAEGIHQNEGNLEGNRDPRETMGTPFEPPNGKDFLQQLLPRPFNQVNKICLYS